jgi:inositol transport system substrate-binding protein
MNKRNVLLLFMAFSVSFAGCARTEVRIGISIAAFDDMWLTFLREAMQERVGQIADCSAFVEDAKKDIGIQLSHVENFVAQGYDAIIVNPADTEATSAMNKLCMEAGIPLVYVNRYPEDGALPTGVYYVGSDEVVAGRAQAEALAQKMAGKGNVVIMLGELSSVGTRGRTAGVKEVFAKYPDIKVVDEQTANFQRDDGLDLMSNWLLGGIEIDAVASNNDEMAIGAIMAMKNVGIVPNKDILVGGVDASPDALDYMKSGDLTVTVFQNAEGQGYAAIDAAYRLAKGETVDTENWIPFEPVTEANYMEYRDRLGLE